MFKIKICGITNVEDALVATGAGADAIGINFCQQSPRCVTSDQAAEIAGVLMDQRATKQWNGWVVGVYVDADFEVLRSTAAATGATNWQLHGNEPPELIERLRGILTVPPNCERDFPVLWNRLNDPEGLIAKSFLAIKAFRCQNSSLNEVDRYLTACQHPSRYPSAVLLDAHHASAVGGTGKSLDWNLVRDQRRLLRGLPLILAGGLTPENVAEAIATVQPDAVDVASGVESAPGKKDLGKIRAFIAAAKEAFSNLAPAKSPVKK